MCLMIVTVSSGHILLNLENKNNEAVKDALSSFSPLRFCCSNQHYLSLQQKHLKKKAGVSSLGWEGGDLILWDLIF